MIISASWKVAMPIVRLLTALIVTAITSSAQAVCPYDSNCLDNPYGAGHTNLFRKLGANDAKVSG